MPAPRAILSLLAFLLLAVAAAPAVDVLAQPRQQAAAFGIEVRQGRKPAPGVEVRLESEGPVRGVAPASQVTDAEGRAELWWLAPGIWRVDLLVDGEVAYFLTVRLDPGRRAEEMGAPARDADAPDLRWKFFRPSGPPPTPPPPPPAVEREEPPAPAPAQEPAPEPAPEPTPEQPAPTVEPEEEPVDEMPAEEQIDEGGMVEEGAAEPVEEAPVVEEPAVEPEPEPAPPARVPPPPMMPDQQPPPTDDPVDEPPPTLGAEAEEAVEPVRPPPPPMQPPPEDLEDDLAAEEAEDAPADEQIDEGGMAEEPMAEEPMAEEPEAEEPEAVEAPATVPPATAPAEPEPATPEPQMPEPEPEPESQEPEPEPVMPEPVPEPVTQEPQVPEPEMPEPQVPEPQMPEPPVTEPPAAEPPPTAPPVEKPPAEVVPPPRPEPAPVEAAPVEAPRFTARSGAAGDCPDCKSEETAVTVERSVAPGSPGGADCGPGMAPAVLEAAQRLSGRGQGLGPGMPLDGGALAPFTAESASCQVLGVVLPPAVRYRGYTYAVEAGGGAGGPCYFPNDCPVAGAVWPARPVIEELADGSRMVYGVFRNASAVPLRAKLTVYYVAGPAE